jgi:hypothetical protein
MSQRTICNLSLRAKRGLPAEAAICFLMMYAEEQLRGA